jgi:hypothetical protein
MKRLAALAFLFCSSVAFAELSDFDFTAEGKLLDQKVANKGDKKETTATWAYDVTLSNKSVKDYANLKIKYIVFVKDVKEGAKTPESKTARSTGEASADAIKAHAKFSFQTNKVELKKTQLAAGWTYTNGARARAADSLAGVWIRIYDGDKQVGEFCDPAGVMYKEHWDAK